MRSIKTWLTTTMIQEGFSNLALLNIEGYMVTQNVTAQVLDVLFKHMSSLFPFNKLQLTFYIRCMLLFAPPHSLFQLK